MHSKNMKKVFKLKKYISFPLKFDLKMKFTTLILIVSLFQLQANNSYAQKTKVTLDLENVSLEKVLNKIESLTGFKFVYKDNVVDYQRIVSIKSRRESLLSILEKLFKGYNIVFKFVDKQIVLKLDEKVNSSSKIKQSLLIDDSQGHDVKGIVVDSNGQPLPGANIIEKGTSNGIQSDFDGKFSLTVADQNAILVISYLGFLTNEVSINGQTSLEITLQEDTANLEEVVLVGYGSQSKKKVTGAISKVTSQQIAQYSTGSFSEAITGTISGVQVNQNGTTPGEDSQIIIRGTGTLTAGTNPLIVVDGFPLSEGSSLSSLNPNDIESINVLKDAASAAIYGSRAANGVLLITTKRGKKQGLEVRLDVYSGVQSRSDDFRTIGAYDYAQYIKEARDYAYTIVDPVNRNASDNNTVRLANGATRRQLNMEYIQPYLDGTPGLTDTNWFDEVYNTAIMSSYNITVSNNTEKSRLTVSLGYLDQDGILIGTGTKKVTSNIRFEANIFNNLKFGINLNTSYDDSDVVDSGNGWNRFPADPSSGVYLQYPFFKPYNDDGSFNISEQIRANTPEDGALAENVVAMTLGSKNVKSRFRSFGTTFLDYEIIEDLKIKTSFGFDFRSHLSDYYQPSSIGTYRTDAVNNSANSSEANFRAENILTETTVNFVKQLGKHKLNILGGYGYQQETQLHTVINATGILDDNLDNIAGGSNFSVDANRQKWTQVSYFGRIQYDFDGKYLLSGSIRTDGSSRFGDNSKWGVFRSISAGWLLSNERFFSENSFISFAKIRGSWGESGNNQIGAYGSISLIDIDNYTNDGVLVPGFATSTSPNDDLSWETNQSTNFGVDLAFFDNKLFLTGEYYVSKTKDLLLNVPVPQQSGFSTSLQNIGELENKGFEFELRGQDFKVGAFTLGFNATLSTNKNKVLALGPDQDQIIATKSRFTFLTQVGGSISELYGYDIIGVYKSQSEIDSSPSLTGTQVGDYIVRDANNDGVLNSDDRIGLGTYNPDFVYSFGGEVKYKNFDFNFAFTGLEGRKVFSYWTGLQIESGEAFVPHTQYYFENRYHPVNNPDGFLAQPNNTFSSARATTRISSNAALDGDYFRLRSVQLGYTFPKQTLDNLGITNLRLYLSGNNLFTVSNFRGTNPEAGSTDPLLQGFYRPRTASIPRIISAGINLTF